MYDTETLLSDEFSSFAARVAEVATNKKRAKEDFKKVYEDYQAHIKALDEEAAKHQQEFEEQLAVKNSKGKAKKE